jgi:hypothetical protein
MDAPNQKKAINDAIVKSDLFAGEPKAKHLFRTKVSPEAQTRVNKRKEMTNIDIEAAEI